MSLMYRELADKHPKKKRAAIEAMQRVDYQSFRDSDDIELKAIECRTKQSFKDECDVNKIIQKHAIEVSKSHLQIYPPEAYAEFDGVDLLEAHARIDRAHEIFSKLPSEVRNEFDNDALRFVAFAGNPENNEKLAELLPAIAKPGRYFPNPVQREGVGAGAATPPPEGERTPDPGAGGSGDQAPAQGASGGENAAPASSTT